MIREKKEELENYRITKEKEEFEYERILISDLSSIVNKFKIELYKKELKAKKNYHSKENENINEVNILNSKYNELRNKLYYLDKENEKKIINLQRKIMIKKLENEDIKGRIEIFEKNKRIEILENKFL